MKFKTFVFEEKESNNDSIKLKIIDFFKNNPSPKDSEIHKFSEKENIDVHKFEEIIYGILGSFFGNGRSIDEKLSKKDVNTSELKMGIEVEMEHTSDKNIAEKIALDHLAECNNYYTKLAKMEKECEK